MSYQRGQDHDGLLEGFQMAERSPLHLKIELAANAWLSRNDESKVDHCLIHPAIERTLLLNSPLYPTVGEPVLKLFGMPVLADPSVPTGEIQLRDHSGKVVGRISWLAND